MNDAVKELSALADELATMADERARPRNVADSVRDRLLGEADGLMIAVRALRRRAAEFRFANEQEDP